MATKPTRQQMHDLAERRTEQLGYPKDPPASTGDPVRYHELRGETYARQLAGAELELTRAYEREQALPALGRRHP